ncbi:hypothetical protein BKA64DRAFT_668346 [Cadophora sp. MPI-SDFR-AT-0126]|nr:hypothetical protein BKA64DRAFT_668346 [Leotiomycetes sp. MPI-SDFR-AT-0126]
MVIVDSIPIHRTLHYIYKRRDLRQRRQMTSLVSSPLVPSEFDDELPSCPDYGKSWQLRSNFLLHLQEQDAHRTLSTTPAARRAIEIDWLYTTDPYLPPRAAPDFRSWEDPDEHVWDYSFKRRQWQGGIWQGHNEANGNAQDLTTPVSRKKNGGYWRHMNALHHL